MNVGMIVLLSIFLGIVFFKIKIGKNIENDFTNKKQANIIRGICCIIVVLVHVPQEHGNVIQDAIGSFGYICVTIFFLLSAYGLKYSLKNKKDYLKHFLRNRLLVIYIPFIIANLIYQIITIKDGFDILRIIGIKDITFVGELILFYLVFYFVYKKIKDIKKADITMISLVIIFSIASYIFKFGWYVECLGFAYGIIIFNLQDKINNLMRKHYIVNWLIATCSSVILGIIYIKIKNVELINYIIKIILGISLISLVAILFKKVRIYNKVLDILGKISYEIFLLHTIIIYILNSLNVASSLYISLVLIITVLCSYVMNIFDNKISKLLKNSFSQEK